METSNTTRKIPDDLRALNITFTVTGLDIVMAHRERVYLKTGRRPTIAKALDALLKSHPCAVGATV